MRVGHLGRFMKIDGRTRACCQFRCAREVIGLDVGFHDGHDGSIGRLRHGQIVVDSGGMRVQDTQCFFARAPEDIRGAPCR